MSEGQEPHRRRDNMRTLDEWLRDEHKIGYEAGRLKAEARIRELEDAVKKMLTVIPDGWGVPAFYSQIVGQVKETLKAKK